MPQTEAPLSARDAVETLHLALPDLPAMGQWTYTGDQAVLHIDVLDGTDCQVRGIVADYARALATTVYETRSSGHAFVFCGAKYRGAVIGVQAIVSTQDTQPIIYRECAASTDTQEIEIAALAVLSSAGDGEAAAA